MPSFQRRGGRQAINVWPGWVDGLSSLVMVIIFVLMVFVVAQFYLSSALVGRDQAMAHLTRQLSELSDELALEKQGSAELRANTAQLSAELQASTARRDDLAAKLSELGAQRDDLASRLAAATSRANSGAAQATSVSRELESAFKVIEADRQKVEAELGQIASLEGDVRTLQEARAKLEADAAALALVIQQSKEQIEALRGQLSTSEAASAAAGTELRLTKEQRDTLTAALEKLKQDQAAAAEQTRQAEEARAKTDADLRLSQEQRDQLLAQLTTLRDRNRTLEASLSTAEDKTALVQKTLSERDLQIQALNQQVAQLNDLLNRLATVLDASEQKTQEQKVQVTDLGKRLNAALASKVEELSGYRSEFFGKLREALGNRPDIRVVGDRFVFQSEVLFPSGSATLQDEGQTTLAQLAATLLAIGAKIPSGINWILRVDGYTDRRPIATPQFASNWELSSARAISVVKYLIDHGVPPERLAAAGFGEYQPIDNGTSEEAFARNRRIELRLDQR